jgi:hypothetical protein
MHSIPMAARPGVRDATGASDTANAPDATNPLAATLAPRDPGDPLPRRLRIVRTSR